MKFIKIGEEFLDLEEILYIQRKGFESSVYIVMFKNGIRIEVEMTNGDMELLDNLSKQEK
jgi:hypothetical protein